MGRFGNSTTGLLLGVGMAAAVSAATPLSPPADFALKDIEGEWHILAHIPYFLENNRVAPTIRFEPRDDGKYTEIFTARKGGFDAPEKSFKQVTWAPEPARPWELRTRLFYIVPAHYQVLSLHRDDGIALLGTKNRDKAWIFSRKPTLTPAEYEKLLGEFRDQGFDTARILRIAQKPADLGKPGYAPVKTDRGFW